MIKNDKENNKFTWGDSVVVKKDAPEFYHPSEFASVCGIDKIITTMEAERLFCKENEWIYLIEFEDGSSIEVPERYLEKNTLFLSH